MIYVKIFLGIVLSLLLWACDNNVMPIGADAHVSLSLLFKQSALPIYHEVIYHADGTTETRSGQSAGIETSQYKLRYIVNCFRADNKGEFPMSPFATFHYTNSNREQLDYHCSMTLPTGTYSIKVWADYVAPNRDEDGFYDTSSFFDIALTGSANDYEGSTDLRQAFIGETALEVPPRYHTDTPLTVEAKMEMTRPLARYKFVTTDKKEFIEKNLGTTVPKETATAFLSQHRILIRYTGFFPNRFNMFTDKPIDAALGYHFMSTMSELDDDSEATLGFDYVFVGDYSSTVSVAVDIYRIDGTLLSSSKPIEVPLLRNRQTVVKGRFLTTNPSGRILINEEYDGSYSVFVN
jgi:hypothetical protein